MGRRLILKAKAYNRGLLFPQNPKIPCAYPVLARLSAGYSRLWGRLPTRYSPVRHFTQRMLLFTFDLHVLGTPPAFVLSQDQTLQFNLKPENPILVLKQLTFLLQNPQLLFRLLFSFQRPSRFVATDSATYLNRINLSRIYFQSFQAFAEGRSRWIDPDRESRTITGT